MKTSSISFVSAKSPTFKGLWGKPKVDANCASGSTYIRKEEYYYPFMDESESEINNAVKSRTTIFKVDWDETMGDIYDISSTVNVENALPFTKEEFNDYKNKRKNDDTSLEKQIQIEESLKENKLSNYINKRYFKNLFKK